jgi:hypothetical protein
MKTNPPPPSKATELALKLHDVLVRENIDKIDAVHALVKNLAAIVTSFPTDQRDDKIRAILVVFTAEVLKMEDAVDRLSPASMTLQ